MAIVKNLFVKETHPHKFFALKISKYTVFENQLKILMLNTIIYLKYIRTYVAICMHTGVHMYVCSTG